MGGKGLPFARAQWRRAAGIDDDQQGPYLHAFGVLVQSKMLIPADQNSPEGSTAS